jgi:hypothetical protein
MDGLAQAPPFGGLNIQNVRETVKPDIEFFQGDLETVIPAFSSISD